MQWYIVPAVLLLVTSGVMAGGLVMVALGIAPTFVHLAPPMYVTTHQTMDAYIERYMPRNTQLTLLLAVITAILRGRLLARVLLVIGIVLTGAVALISETRNVPINKQVLTWNPDTPPGDMNAIFARWIRFNWLRTAAGVLALAVFAAATILPA
ncbi:MAG: anthrone oxygenase family protein [Thermomicrobiales bacterium]